MYPSGQSFPLKLSIQSKEAPALAELLIQGFEAELVKHLVARSPSGQIVGGREVILSKGNFPQTDTTQEGFATSYIDLTLGKPGKEQSWGITGAIEIAVSLPFCVFSLSGGRIDSLVGQYLIRVSVRCPDSTLKFVPTYRHVSRIGVATEPWGVREGGLLGFGGFSDPALEIGDERLQLRRPSSVQW
jgi:hypothetical protein